MHVYRYLALFRIKSEKRRKHPFFTLFFFPSIQKAAFLQHYLLWRVRSLRHNRVKHSGAFLTTIFYLTCRFEVKFLYCVVNWYVHIYTYSWSLVLVNDLPVFSLFRRHWRCRNALTLFFSFFFFLASWALFPSKNEPEVVDWHHNYASLPGHKIARKRLLDKTKINCIFSPPFSVFPPANYTFHLKVIFMIKEKTARK